MAIRHHRKILTIIVTCAVLIPVFLSGCELKGRLRPVVLPDLQPVEKVVDYGDLAAVLQEAVDGAGMVREIDEEVSARLDRQLRRLEIIGPTASPELLPSAEDRLAYWFNARAAWALKLALLAGRPETISRRELEARPFILDGRVMTLEKIDNILGRYGWRELVVAPSVLLQRARLPARPFDSETLRQRINDRLNDFIDDERRFVLDIEHEQVLVPPILWRYRRRLLEAHAETYGAEGASLVTALLPYVSGSAHRRLQEVVGFPSRRARPDRSLAVSREY